MTTDPNNEALMRALEEARKELRAARQEVEQLTLHQFMVGDWVISTNGRSIPGPGQVVAIVGGYVRVGLNESGHGWVPESLKRIEAPRFAVGDNIWTGPGLVQTVNYRFYDPDRHDGKGYWLYTVEGSCAGLPYNNCLKVNLPSTKPAQEAEAWKPKPLDMVEVFVRSGSGAPWLKAVVMTEPDIHGDFFAGPYVCNLDQALSATRWRQVQA